MQIIIKIQKEINNIIYNLSKVYQAKKMKNIFILLVTFISFFLASGWAVAQQSRTDVKIDGMYFSYYSNKNEVVKLQFNIAGKNVSEIELYVKYKYKGQGGGFKTANIKCSSTDLGTRNQNVWMQGLQLVQN